MRKKRGSTTHQLNKAQFLNIKNNILIKISSITFQFFFRAEQMNVLLSFLLSDFPTHTRTKDRLFLSRAHFVPSSRKTNQVG